MNMVQKIDIAVISHSSAGSEKRVIDKNWIEKVIGIGMEWNFNVVKENLLFMEKEKTH